MAEGVEADVREVKVKGRRREKVGFRGRGEGIACEGRVVVEKK